MSLVQKGVDSLQSSSVLQTPARSRCDAAHGVTGQTAPRVETLERRSGLSGGTQVHEERQHGATGYLFYHLALLQDRERVREGETGETGGNQSSILFSTLRRATSGSVTLHLHRTISLAKVHKTTKYLVTYCLTCSAE